jgi:hypothetical protein
MNAIITMIAGLALALPLVAENRSTIYVDRMEGMEPFVEKALQDAKLGFNFVEELKRPDLKANLESKHSAYGEVLYKTKLGRSDTHSLQLWDLERHEVIASYEFTLSNSSDEARSKAAEEFAKRVKQALASRRIG